MSKRFSAFHSAFLCRLFQSSSVCFLKKHQNAAYQKTKRLAPIKLEDVSPRVKTERVEKQALVPKLRVRKVWALLRLPGAMEALDGVFTSIRRASLTVFPPQSPGGGQGRCPQAARGCYANTLENTVALENLSLLLRQTIKSFVTR